jgi:hypothetical protein
MIDIRSLPPNPANNAVTQGLPERGRSKSDTRRPDSNTSIPGNAASLKI